MSRLFLFLLIPLIASGAGLHLQSPADFQVFQRHSSKEGTILFSGVLSEPMEQPVRIEYRIDDAWMPLMTVNPRVTEFSKSVTVTAGGWYEIRVRARDSEGSLITESSAVRAGVGEIFIVAGQSNSANHSEEKLKTQTGKVAAFDGETWRLSADPQPGASGNRGSFIPPFGDAIVERFGVPIGIISTGVGATSVREWLPKGVPFPNPPTLTGNVNKLPNGQWEAKGELFGKLVSKMKAPGPQGFRAVLWHQGESDANQRDTTRTLSGEHYTNFLTRVIKVSQKEAGWQVPWFVAQASYHTPDDPGSPDLRAGQAALWESGIALEGPDTDRLTGDLRENGGKGVHFSGKGQRAHAKAWAEKVIPWLEKEVRPVKVFILAGQSNMQGQGVVAMDHPEYYNGGKGNLVWSMEHSAGKERMRHLRDASGNWVERDDVDIIFKSKDKVRRGPLTIGYTGYGGDSHIGPELQFGHVIGDHFAERVLLIKTAWGGKSLREDFRPPSSGGETGPFYQQMIAEIREALGAVPHHELCGFVWMQGWNDMVSTEATAEYAANLVNLAKDIRSEFGTPDLPFVVGELGNGGPAKAGSGMDAFRKAQKLGTAQIRKAVFVPTADFARPKELSPNTGHGHHWFGNAESYFLIGDALGRAMIDALKSVNQD